MERSVNVKNELNGDSFSSQGPPQSPPALQQSTSSSQDVDSGTLTPSLSGSPNNSKMDDNGGSPVGPAKENSGSKTNTDDPIDGESQKGIFGWETLDGTSIPYLLRRGKKYVSIRIVERKLLSKYPNKSPDELGKKDPLVSHFITEAEANLLNEINVSHCDYEYGNSSFSKKDLVVDLEEFDEFFKLVKKTFPEDVLASIKGEATRTTPQVTPAPPEPQAPTPAISAPNSAPNPAPCCGWVQINNTVSPYIIRGTGKNRAKLVPLSVIVYAAGLLTNANVKGILPSAEECKMLNAACKAAGFDFTFARNTRLISISMIVERCPQVQIFELPISNPLQHAQYLDQRMSAPPASFNPALRQSVPSPFSSTPMGPAGVPLNGMGDQRPPFFMNPFLPRFHGPEMSAGVRPGGMAPSGINFDPRHPSADTKLSNLDPSQLPVSIQQALLDKCHRLDSAAAASVMSKMSANLRPPFWPLMPGQPPPAHSGKSGNLASKPPLSPFDAPPAPPMSSSTLSSIQSSSSSSSSYQPLSLPPNPLLHSTSLDVNHPIYRIPGMPPPPPQQPPSSSPLSSSTKDNPIPQPHYPPHPSRKGPSPSHQSQGTSSRNTPPSHIISSSLFTRSDSMEAKKPTNPQPSPSVITSLNQQQMAAAKRQTASPSQCRNSNDNLNHNVNLVKCISASLVNGKSISCLDADTATRKGKYCLVEAVSKLYFPAVPIAEFLKVLIMVLNAKLYACTPDEEAAFVQYYNLPAPRLKCNQMILVEDLTRYFPQLNYVFNQRGNTNHIQSEESQPGDNNKPSQKRPAESAPSGPQGKQASLESVVQKMHSDKHLVPGNTSGTRNGSATGSVIVIDD